MGYKDICLKCRKAFNRGTDYFSPEKLKCTECDTEMFPVNHKFQPPKKLNAKEWEVVSYLVKNGFDYSSVYHHEGENIYRQYGKFPTNMREAKEFVEIFKRNIE